MSCSTPPVPFEWKHKQQCSVSRLLDASKRSTVAFQPEMLFFVFRVTFDFAYLARERRARVPKNGRGARGAMPRYHDSSFPVSPTIRDRIYRAWLSRLQIFAPDTDCDRRARSLHQGRIHFPIPSFAPDASSSRSGRYFSCDLVHIHPAILRPLGEAEDALDDCI